MSNSKVSKPRNTFGKAPDGRARNMNKKVLQMHASRNGQNVRWFDCHFEVTVRLQRTLLSTQGSFIRINLERDSIMQKITINSDFSGYLITVRQQFKQQGALKWSL